MSAWPRSLLGRNLLLIAALVVASQLCAVVLVRQMVLQPRVAQVADGVAHNVAALRAGLDVLPPGRSTGPGPVPWRPAMPGPGPGGRQHGGPRCAGGG